MTPMRSLQRVLIGAITSVVLAASAAAQSITSAEFKAQVRSDVASMKKQTQVMIDTVFSFGELGFQEVETSRYLTGLLEKEGFKIERGIGGMGGDLGFGQAGDRARLRHRLHPASLTKTRRRLS